MAAAVTTGVVALMLQSDPALAPDDVKCRLLASARPAVTCDRHARVQRLPAGRRPHQRRIGGQQLGDGLRESRAQHRRRSRRHAALRRPRQRGCQRQLLRHEHGGLDLGRLDSPTTAIPGRPPTTAPRAIPGARATPGARRTPGTRPTPGAAATPWSKGYTWSEGLHLEQIGALVGLERLAVRLGRSPRPSRAGCPNQ